MYKKSAPFYNRLYAFKDYKAEAALVTDLIKARRPMARTLLDVACGTGNHLTYLKNSFQAEGLDLCAELVRIARETNPDLRIDIGDMMTFRLPRRHDVITCLFSSIGYVRTVRRLRMAVRTMASHLSDDGLLIVEPWFTPEGWHVDTTHGLFVNEPELKIARLSTSKARGNLSIMDMHFLVSTPEGTKHFVESHAMGLFSEKEMRDSFEAARLRCEYLAEGITGRGLYIGERATRAGA
jgi:SAM-dependent methyltransferase